MSGLTLEHAAQPALPTDSPGESIREMLSRHGFPDAQFTHLWAGRGTQCCCEACGRTITGDDVEYELEYRQGTHRLTVVLHRDCWEEWRQV